jgi:REP element-mobilizing transposase RayT
MEKHNQQMYDGQYYHIYNRGNNHDRIFFNAENYNFFLKKFDYYLSEYLDVYCYCLLPNHFHFLVRVKDKKDLPSLEDLVSLKIHTSGADLPIIENLGSIKALSNQFRLFFMSYSKSVNQQQGRIGSLFQKTFKRKLITNDSYLKAVVFYIHFNPQKHGLTDDFKTYTYSSYNRFVSEKVTKLRKDEVFNFFNGKPSFVEFHNDMKNNKLFGELDEIEI